MERRAQLGKRTTRKERFTAHHSGQKVSMHMRIDSKINQIAATPIEGVQRYDLVDLD